MLKKLLTTTSIAIIGAASIAQADNNTLIFTGMSFDKNSNYFYAGGVVAPFGSISEDGVLLRAVAARGSYDYSRVGNTDVNADTRSVEAMVGYQLFDTLGFTRITAYAGVDHQNHELTPADPNNRVQGYETEAKGLLEAVIDISDNIDFDIAGSYSGAFDTYWSQNRLGFGCGCGFKFGPEFIALGSESYDQQRYGAFISDIALGEDVKGSVSAGYANASRRGDNGGYVQFGVSFLF